MNALILLGIAIIVLALGYRFHAKFLWLCLGKPNVTNYSPSPQALGSRASTLWIFGHYSAILITAGSITGTLAAVFWGWIPAFLWIISATVLLGAFFGMAAFWLAAQHPHYSLSELVHHYIGPYSRQMFHVLAIMVLLLLSLSLLHLSARLLAHFPSIALAAVLQIPLLIWLGRLRQWRPPYLALIAVLLVTGLGLWLSRALPLSFSGGFNLDISGHSWLTLDATAAWRLLLLATLYGALRLPARQWRQPRAQLSALLGALMFGLLLIGLIVAHPTTVAPEFQSGARPSSFPWLWLTLGSGAIAGFHWLMAHHISREYRLEPLQIRPLGYGGALADGSMALGALLIASAGFQQLQQWQDFYLDWGQLQNGFTLLLLYLNGLARFLSGLGIGHELAREFAALALLGLMLTTLETCVYRLLQRWDAVLAGTRRTAWQRQAHGPRSTLVLLASLAVVAPMGASEQLWPLLGLGNLVLATLGMGLLALALRQQARPPLAAYLATAALLLMTLWAGSALLQLSWSESRPWQLIGALLLVLMTLGILLELLLRRPKPLAPPAQS